MNSETDATAPVPAEHVWFSKAFLDVGAERRRQIEKEGFDYAHDDQYQRFELAKAGVTYATHATLKDATRKANLKNTWAPGTWPWKLPWWKPKDRRSDLVRAAALIVAEIERMDRADG